MKNKSILIIFITILLVIVIYIFNQTTNNTVLILGDYTISNLDSYSNKIDEKKIKYALDDNRTIDLINNIKTNILIEDKPIKNLLIKANYIIVDIGNNELFYRLTKETIINEDLYSKGKEITNYINDLFITLRETTKEPIYFTSFYNPYSDEYNTLIEYLNSEVKKYSEEHNVNFIDITKCIENNSNRTDYQLNNIENKCIADMYENIDK